MNNSKLLLNEQPLLIMPQLATKIGLNESIVLQQIHYWNEINRKANNNFKDGYYWTFSSYENWEKQFPFWSKNTVKRAMRNLEKYKLVVVGNFNRLKIDRTKWYRIDYNVLQALETCPLSQIGSTNVSKWVDHLTKLGRPLPETNTEINSEITLTSDKSAGYLFFEELKADDLIKQINNIVSPKRTKISIDNYHTATEALDLDEDHLNEYISSYLEEKDTGRSVENFIKHLERYNRE